MSVIAKVEPLYILEQGVSRDVVCRVTKFTGLALPEVRIVYFPADITTDELEAEIAGMMETAEIHIQACFYLPVKRVDFP